jgi:Protein of unknown function (DUF3823) N-terminal domain/Domain of unknown function (DUF3823_C)
MILRKITFLLILGTLLASCELDNYEEPNGAIYGNLIDDITKEPLESEQPAGFNIKLYEKGGRMNAPIIFSGKPDGTFENAWIFRNEYKVVPTEGAFFPVDTAVVQVGERSEVNFTVTPFLAVTNVSVQPGSGKITSSYKIARSRIGDKIIERKTLVSKIPTTNNVVFNFKSQTDLSGTADADILAAQYTDEVTNLAPGQYYVRIAVRTKNGLNKYNYSKVFKVTVP